MNRATGTIRRITCVSLLALAILWAPLAGAAPAATSHRPAASASAQRATPEEALSYARRDRQATPDLARFVGGDEVVIITTTTVTLVLLVLLAVIIL